MPFVKLLKVLTLMTCLVFVGQGFAMESWLDHKSTTDLQPVNGCYQIASAEDLAWFADYINRKSESTSVSYCGKLISDLDLGGYFWIPISVGGTRHVVNFDGNGHVIKNLYLSAAEMLALPDKDCVTNPDCPWKNYPNKTSKDKAQNLGLIGASMGVVQNVILENVEVYAYGKNYSSSNTDDPVKGPLSIGTVVGWQSNSNNTKFGPSVVENCYVTGTMITAGDGQAVGGIVGNNGGGIIRNCYSAVNITANGVAYVGGIVGYTKDYKDTGNEAFIESCVYAGKTLSADGIGIINNIEYESEAGAIVGNHYNGATSFSNVYYDSDKFENGVGASMGGAASGEPSGVSELNSNLIACTLNGGEYDDQNETCSKEYDPWSVEQSGISLSGYGADGFKVTFHANGGSFGDEVSSIAKYVKAGVVINDDGVSEPINNDKSVYLAGWALTQGATKPEDLGTGRAVTVYAVWKPIHTITFNANPGLFPDGASEKEVLVKDGHQISVGEDFGKPSRTDYYFRGWATAENPTKDDALIDEKTGLDNLPVATGNQTLYAVWVDVPTHVVTFNANGQGSVIAKYLEVKENQKISGLTAQDFESVKGYDLQGWYLEPGCTNEFDFVNTSIGEDITLYAKWEIHAYNITYDLNCDEKCSLPNDAENSYTVNGLVLKAPNLEDDDWGVGHRFLGWSDNSNGSNIISSIPEGTIGDKTLTAVWDVDVFTITYNAGAYGKGDIIPAVQMEYGVPHVILGERFERNGFVQDGWSTSDGSETIDYEFDQSVSNVSLNLYPHWSLKENTLAVKAVSAEFSYDGNTHAAECRVEGEVPDGYTISSSSTPTVRNVSDGYKTASCTLKIRDEKNKDVTKSFTIVSTKGSISVKAAEVHNYGSGAIKILWDENGYRAEIDGNYQGNESVEIPSSDNVTVTRVIFNREFTSGAKSTVMFPFTVSLNDVSGGEFWEFKEMEYVSGAWKFRIKEPEDNELKANKPYIFVADQDSKNISFDLKGKSVSLSTEDMDPSVINGWVFGGTYEKITFTEAHSQWAYAYGYVGEAGKGLTLGRFIRFKTSGKSSFELWPMRAYLVYDRSKALTKSAGVSENKVDIFALPENIDIEIVGKNAIVIGGGVLNTVTGEVKMDRWYDLRGRRLNGKPTTQGTYYYNGKRVIVR